ncbi:GldG family protein [Haloplanus pelagicus]|jgi:hypothetical protein|uniref:GldG family protein n=1 Tax=Haloplanus pelagicus TaxID=2949995 RepID=UPI002041520C|nr:GldG family protein [Haloplanus sp. HW8-1]
MWWREAGKRIAVLALTVVVVVAGAAIVPALLSEPDTETSLENPEYAPAEIAPDPLPATGTIDADPGPDATTNGTVLIDRGHANRFTRADIEPLVDALIRQGFDVEFYTSGDLATALEDVDAFLVIDPGAEYPAGDVDDVRQFTGNGGHLVMVGEPDRTAISSSLFGTSIQTQQSQLTTLASSYGMSVDTQYLYNQEHADGTFKHVVARPTGEADLGDIERTTMYTAAAVTVDEGTVLLRSAPNTHKSGSDEVTGEYAVAVRSNNAVLLGDKTFLRGDRFNVADNERFVAYLAEFVLRGEHRPRGDDEGKSDDEDGPPPADDGATTATATPTPTPETTSTPTPEPVVED